MRRFGVSNRRRPYYGLLPSGPVATVAPAFPLNLPQTNLQCAFRPTPTSVTLATTVRKTGTGGTVTLTVSGDATPIYVIVVVAGTVGNFKFFLSLDHVTFTTSTPITSAATYAVPGTSHTLNFGAATYTIGCIYEAEVASIADSKNAYSMVFASAKRPTLIGNAGGIGIWGLKSYGAQIGKVTGTTLQTDLGGGADTPNSIYSAVRWDSDPTGAGTETIYTLSKAAGQALSRLVRDLASGQLRCGRRDDGGGTVIVPTSSGTFLGRTNHRVRSSFPGTTHTIEKNGSVIMNAQAENVGTLTLDEFTALGSNVNGTEANFSTGLYLMELDGYSGAPDTGTDTAVLAQLDSRYAEPSTDLLASTKFWDTGSLTPAVQRIPHDYRDCDPFHTVKFTTSAASVQVGAVVLVPNGTYTFDKVFAIVDGAYHSTLDYSATPLQSEGLATLTLDGASHAVELWGLADIRRVVGITPDTYSAPARRIVIQGDSITVGREATNFCDGWNGLMKRTIGASYGTTMIGYAGRKLSEVAGSGPLITADVAKVVARLDGSAKNIFVMTLGVNDFLNNVTSATYGTQLTNYFTALQAALPSVIGVILSPIGKSTEGPNGGGSTLTDYRAAAAAVAVTLSLTHINGGTALPYAGGDFNADGLHPNDTGHGKLDTYIRPILAAL